MYVCARVCMGTAHKIRGKIRGKTGPGVSHVHEIQTPCLVSVGILGAVFVYTRAHVCIEREGGGGRERYREGKEVSICAHVYMGTT